jgi:WS/DGAT/MGAT family acyltransferase
MDMPGAARLRAWLDDPTRMGSVDRAWLRMDDPTNLMVVNALIILAEPLSLEDLRALVEDRLAWIRRMRLQVHRGLLWDRWREDPLDLDRHVHESVLESPGDDEQLRELISGLISEPLDPDQPLWQLRVIQNTRAHGGEQPASALLCRVHHSVGDGVALLLVLLSLTDAELDARERSFERNPLRELFVDGGHEAVERARHFLHEIMPTGMKLMLHRDLAALTGERVRANEGLRASLGRGARLGKAFAGDLASLVLRRPDASTVFRGRLGVAKRVAWSAPIELERVRDLHRALGVTVNDVLLAAMTGGLRRYLVERGESPTGVELRAAVPINLRSLGEMARLGNRFGLVFLTLPVGLADPRERLAELRRRMSALKHSVEPVLTWGILELMGAGPRLLEQLILAYFARRVSFVMTNVPGPERPLYLAGREVAGVMFWVPQSGRVGMGVSIFSYAGTLRVGVACDAELVPDPERLIAGFHAELEAMLELGEGM